MTAPTAPDSSHPFQNKRVLLVDDQRAFQVLMKSMLHTMGLGRVTMLSHAEEARRRCTKEQFDIYLIDYNLGSGENGRQLLSHLRERQLLPAEAIAVIVSGDNSRAMVLSALESEPDDYLMKPFSTEQLRHRLLRAIRRKQSLKPVFQALALQDHQAIIQACRQALADKTRYATYCRCLMAESLLREGETESAYQLLRDGLARGESSWLRLGLGKACHLLGQYEKACEHLNTALTLRPLMVEAYRWLAKAKAASGNGEAAMEILSRAIQISPQSPMLHQQMTQTCLSQGNYLKARESLHAMLELNRYAVQDRPQDLGNYVHCLILHAVNSDDPYHIANLPKQVNSVLSRCRQAKMEESADFIAFEQICQARVQMVCGDLMRAKRMLYKANHGYLERPEQMPAHLLSETVLALMQLGEFEYAEELQPLLAHQQAQDPMLAARLQTVCADSWQQERMKKYTELNQHGIQAYKEGQLGAALESFREALRRAPANTSAALNKAQVLLQLLNGRRGRERGNELYEECRSTLALLNGILLNAAQRTRLEKLQHDFAQQKKP